MAKEKRVSKMVSAEDAKKLIDMSYYDMESTDFIMEWFGLIDGKRKYNPYDIMIVPPGSYGPEGKKNKNTFTTTIGLFVFNKLFVERYIFNAIPYVPFTITKKTFGKINKIISYAILEDKMTIDDLKNFLQMTQKFQPYGDILCWSFTEELFDMLPKLKALKNKLYKEKYKAQIDAGDPKAASDMEAELLKCAQDMISDDPSYDMFESGAKSSFGNNFKNLFIMRGAVANPKEEGRFEIIMSNFLDGVDNKKDYIALCRSATEGAYSRGKKTANGGYLEKLIFRATQHLKLLPHGTDCHTKKYISVLLTDDNIDIYIYSNIIEGNKLVNLTMENKDKYVGKEVKIRCASLCESENGICSACAGELFYKLDMLNIGSALPQIASSIKLKAMKAFHDAIVHFHEIDLNKVFNIK